MTKLAPTERPTYDEFLAWYEKADPMTIEQLAMVFSSYGRRDAVVRCMFVEVDERPIH